MTELFNRVSPGYTICIERSYRDGFLHSSRHAVVVTENVVEDALCISNYISNCASLWCACSVDAV